MPLVGILVAIALFAFYIARTRELFFLSLRHGEVLLVRGRISPALLADLQNVVAAPKVGRGFIQAVMGPRFARLELSGLDASQAQRVRNILGTWPVARLRSARPLARQTVGQRLGIAWLAWRLEPRR